MKRLFKTIKKVKTLTKEQVKLFEEKYPAGQMTHYWTLGKPELNYILLKY